MQAKAVTCKTRDGKILMPRKAITVISKDGVFVPIKP
jgi:hypothetical protein